MLCSDTALISIDLQAVTPVGVECGILYFGKNLPYQASGWKMQAAVPPKFWYLSVKLNGITLRETLMLIYASSIKQCLNITTLLQVSLWNRVFLEKLKLPA
jgi:hypothetical protein